MAKQRSTVSSHQSLAGEYTCFFISNEEYGIRTALVSSVVEEPVVRKVPKAPAFVEGVANIRGRIVPVLNPAERLGLLNSDGGGNGKSTVNSQQSKLLLVNADHSLYGLLIGMTSSITFFSEEMIEPVNPIMVRKEAPFIRAMAKTGERLIYLLDIEAFINAGLDLDQEKKASYDHFAAGMSASLRHKTKADQRQVLLLATGSETCGLDLACLVELVPAHKMKKTGKGPKYLAGLVETGAGTLPVIDLQKKLGLASIPYGEDARIAVIRSANGGIGILANRISEMVNVGQDEIREVPAVISGQAASHIKGVVVLEEGERLVVFMDETKILSNKEIEKLNNLEQIKTARERRAKKTLRTGADYLLLGFRVADIEFAVDIRATAEVIQYNPPQVVPRADPFIRGIVSVRGELVTVIDLRKRFDLTAEKKGAENRIIVIRSAKATFGVIADSVTEILSVSKTDIVPPPKIVKGIDARFIAGLLSLKDTDRVLIVIDPNQILAIETKAGKVKKRSSGRKKKG